MDFAFSKLVRKKNVFTQLEGMKKKDSLFHLVTKDYHQANIWVQLKSGDNVDMEAVVADVEKFMAANKGHLARDHDGDPVYLTRLQWDIDRIERDYPEVTLSPTKEMMV